MFLLDASPGRERAGSILARDHVEAGGGHPSSFCRPVVISTRPGGCEASRALSAQFSTTCSICRVSARISGVSGPRLSPSSTPSSLADSSSRAAVRDGVEVHGGQAAGRAPTRRATAGRQIRAGGAAMPASSSRVRAGEPARAQHRDVAHDHRQHVAEVVGDSAGQGPDALHLPGLRLLLQAAAR